VHGPQILSDFLSTPGPENKFGDRWQYNSQSDRHSKVGCWGVAFDLLVASALLRKHVMEKKVVLGVNHTMQDFQTHRRKALDLVIARPAQEVLASQGTFKSKRHDYKIQLSDAQEFVLNSLPDVPVGEVGAVLIALEAKAVMTAHVKALPRLYDELNSSHLCVHGASNQAIAIAYVQINASSTFASSVRNNFKLGTRPLEITEHKQPSAVARCLEKVAELPRRTGNLGVGFDGIGATVIDFENQGGKVDVVSSPPAPQIGDPFHYETMIVRMANEYDTRFAGI
jgi:hypothetical protein